jgi:hypothetical protein
MHVRHSFDSCCFLHPACTTKELRNYCYDSHKAANTHEYINGTELDMKLEM